MNCKPGDLAWVVQTIHTPEILGHIVEVVGPWPHPCASESGFVWEIRYPDGRMILASLSGGVKRLRPSRAFNDSKLRPIRPGDLNETETTDERKEVTA